MKATSPSPSAATANIDQRAGRGQHDAAAADVICALHKAGLSLRQLSLANGLHERTLAVALRRPYAHGEIIIARALRLRIKDLWPERVRARAQQRRRGRA